MHIRLRRHTRPHLQRYGQRVTAIDKDAQCVSLADGSTLHYETLVCTMPLDTTLRWLGKGEWSDGLHHSSTHIVGVGIRGAWCVGPKQQGSPGGLLADMPAPAPHAATAGGPSWTPARFKAWTAPLLTPKHSHCTPCLPVQPPRHQVLALFPRGQLPLLSDHCLLQLRSIQLPSPRGAAAHAVPGRWQRPAGRGQRRRLQQQQQPRQR